ncbi:MAG: hypothetical protein NZM12_10195, partial [Steroidobacteraceae bacterium]|nr:hypothetical protein [Steroidobacteraceae bacterium]
MNAFATLIRREFWEHRSLWLAPAIAAAIIVALTLLSSVHSRGFGITIDSGEIDSHAAAGARIDFLAGITPQQQATIFGVTLILISIPILIAAGVAIFLYLADALYAERKDRSILFWKSLPVSDAATVWSKLVTALGAAPLLTWGICAVAVTLCFLALQWRASGTPFAQAMAWDTATWLRVHGIGLLNL